MSAQQSPDPQHTVGAQPTYAAFSVGSDITALLPLLAMRLANEPNCRFLVIYGNYGERSDAQLEELLGLKDQYLERLAVHFIMEREPEESELLTGRLDAHKLRAFATQLFDAHAVREYFMSGPHAFVEELGEELRKLGVEPGRVHTERNAAPPSAGSQLPSAASAQPQAGVTQVTVIRDGRRQLFAMRTGEESILDAAARAGLDLPFSCRAGVCSTCRTKLLRGEVELAQNYALEDWELAQGFILACQAHAKTSDLEISYDEK
jgi:ring-1,2-phenylacetyl-CoA epoxidase subunit PaaE